MPALAAADQPTDYGGVVAALSREIPSAMKASHTVGLSIALVDGDRTVWARGFGWADRARRVPVGADTLFHIGSVSKTMTAAAVMQLVEQGRVDLDAPLSRYVPQFSLLPRFPGSVITVRSVLDMHSGIPGEVDNGLISAGRPIPGAREWLLGALRRTYPERPANTAWAYSNSGYILLQNLVENVTGQDFDTYTREHLFGPMAMASTTFNDASVPDARLARPYQAVATKAGTLARLQPREFLNGWAAGSVMSSANDMANYLKTMIAGGAGPNGRILADSTVQAMITPQTDLPLDITVFRQGLGWEVGDATAAWMGPAMWWNGATVNYQTYLRWLPELDLGVFVSVNTSSAMPPQKAVGQRALGLMVTAKTGRRAPPPASPSRVVRVSAVTLRRAAGRYASTFGVDRIQASGGALRWTPSLAQFRPPGAATVSMRPRADGWYTPLRPRGAVSIKPATVAGRRLLLARLSGAVYAIAEKIPAGYRIPPAWRARTGAYRAINVLPGTYPGLVARTARLTIRAGLLLWTTEGSTPSVLAPAGPRRAFTFGFFPGEVQRGAGEAVIPAGNTLTLLGVTYRRTAR